jgi:ABC-type Fe3+ transport system substrate-binding protein
LIDDGDEPKWFGTALSSFGISYNLDVIKHLGLPEPTTWRDLADPKYRGWIVLADPTRSSSAKAAFMIIIERAMADAANGIDPNDKANYQAALDSGWADGMGIVRQIAANARNFNDGSQSIPSTISSGDVAAGMTIDFYANAQISFVGSDRMRYVEPANATMVNPDPIGLLKGAPNRELAIRFIEWLLTPDAQRLWVTKAGSPGGPKTSSLYRLPIVRSVYEHPVDFIASGNPLDRVSTFNTSPARKKTFSILGELIQASCMDLLDELRETRQVILASPKAAELDRKLARFPFDQKEALRRLDEYKKADALTKLQLMRTWTAEFREEYRKLRDEAR